MGYREGAPGAVGDSKQAYHAAFNAVQAELEPVRKEALQQPDTKSHYARLEDVLSALVPIITKHGFSRSVSEDPPTGRRTRR